MKKLLYTLLAVSIIFSACEEEDAAPNTNNTNTGVNNSPSNLIGSWHSEEVLDEYRGNMYYDKIHFYSNGDSYREGGVYAAVPNSQNQTNDWNGNSAYEIPDDGYINFSEFLWLDWSPGNNWYMSTANYLKYNINGNILTFTNLEDEPVYWHNPLEHPLNHDGNKAVYTKQ